MSYFKFELPEGKGYSPNWCGSCFVPKNPKVLAYNEPEGFGIACCDTPKEDLDLNLTALSEEEALSLVAEASKQKGAARVFVEETLTDKWLAEPVGIEALPTVDPETGEEEQPAEPDLIDNTAKFCPDCFELLTLTGKETVDSEVEGLLAESANEEYSNPEYRVLTCPNGHRVKEVLNGK